MNGDNIFLKQDFSIDFSILCVIVGARMVRELFVMAREHAPSIIFMDEIDSIGSSRLEGGSGGDSEVQRTMLELLNQLDGFEATKNIKVRYEPAGFGQAHRHLSCWLDSWYKLNNILMFNVYMLVFLRLSWQQTVLTF